MHVNRVGQARLAVAAAPVAATATGPTAGTRSVRIAPMTGSHAAQVLAIYQAGIAEGNATFEEAAPSWDEFSAGRLPGHRYVALDTAGPAEAAPDDVTYAAGPADGPADSAAGPADSAAGPADSAAGGGTDVLGWVAISATSSRSAYAGVVEHSVYVRPDARGRGIGRLLLGAVIESTEAAGIWTIQSGIFPENEASIALHAAAGFRVVGRRERIGRHQGRWRDILLLERRSPIV
ncbi:MAG TPA: GNAT family N-acetyltransferase [Streptosporangiaceae bacterium]|nr:GNAT family N-acetyltransferase [Streptosporangiaceae bacterium]